jgi:hypothetical protein
VTQHENPMPAPSLQHFSELACSHSEEGFTVMSKLLELSPSKRSYTERLKEQHDVMVNPMLRHSSLTDSYTNLKPVVQRMVAVSALLHVNSSCK